MTNPVRNVRFDIGFAVTVFVSAFLLFQVQPLISKSILPWFGGSPAVWTTCMLFFQVVLFAGYLYAHLLTKLLENRGQAIVHIALMVAAALLLPIIPNSNWKPNGPDDPVVRIVLLLGVTVGLPYFILSSTGPLLQCWFSRQHPGKSPYRLYALSNIGSLLALISYPFVVETTLDIGTQASVWSFVFILFAASCAVCAARISRLSDQSVGETESMAEEHNDDATSSIGTRVLWFALAMVPSTMLLATTNQVCLDVASIPFLWVLPLTLYLMSFILCFDSDRWYSRESFTAALAVSMVCVTTVLFKGSGVALQVQVLVYFSALFFCCMVCHGELALLKPSPKRLTSFYLTISAGGAGGGIFVGLIAPAIFPTYLELHIAVLASIVLTLAVFFRDRKWTFHRGRPRWVWCLMLVLTTALAIALTAQAGAMINRPVEVQRNFYGVLRIFEVDADVPERHRFEMKHGNILHGMQFVNEKKRELPTTYYGPESGVGLMLRVCKTDRPRRIGVVGLGAGTLAAYGKPGDTMRFYEINRDVIRLANQYFSFMNDSPAKIETVLGDARLSLEHEEPRNFDILVLDAFSGDAIPTHLLTKEAFGVYRRHLKPDGILAVHISNLHFDLRPVIDGLSHHYQMDVAQAFRKQDREAGTNSCLWMLLSNHAAQHSEAMGSAFTSPANHGILWTDQRSNLFEIMR